MWKLSGHNWGTAGIPVRTALETVICKGVVSSFELLAGDVVGAWKRRGRLSGHNWGTAGIPMRTTLEPVIRKCAVLSFAWLPEDVVGTSGAPS